MGWKCVVEPAHMWWLDTLVQISLFRMLHEKDNPNILENVDGSVNKHQMSRSKFFLIAFFCSFLWYLFPGYLFQTLRNISWVCWVFPHSVTAHQIGSGRQGLGVGALTLDWSVVAFLSSPLISPFFVIANVFLGYFVANYIVIPISYWVLNVYNAKTFPIYSMDFFTANGKKYNISAVVDHKLELDIEQYRKQGEIHLSLVFSLAFGFGFATLASTVTQVALFYGREIYECYWASSKAKKDLHTKLMKSYKDVPSWWFYVLLVVTMLVSVFLCIFLEKEIQMPFWAFLLAAALAFSFTLPISIITATTNRTPGLNVITQYIMGVIYPGRPIANVCFKVYGYVSMTQAIAFLSDFKLGHYMKIPPRSIFLVQLLGTMITSTVNMIVAWWLLHLDGMCNPDKLSNSPWTCPVDHIFFDASVIWGLIGSKRIFGKESNYSELNWFFLAGLLGPVVVWGCHKAFPKYSWIPLIKLPVILGAAAQMARVSALNYNSWILVGTTFNFFVFKYRKKWWQRYNYILSAALDAGVAFMVVFLYFTLGIENKTISWWGNNNPEHCDLALCPIAKGVTVDGCPVF
ncbi:Sexual differentiation process protein ISP4 [Handroanthus impetiginosus]|uniref:Sexual differentiation process protein ISP4 n=1 Tax=Handroanthus impetiginosus TaxID=429701 RepID=A0A2G9HYQ1_9LAMI|nr:Sexual differentiation process protein ISP4 [Handroanthus impetiginosus]